MEAMLSSNATDDHCNAFAEQGGIKPLLSLLTLPHLPLDFAGCHACDSIAAVVKSMIGLSRNGQLVTKTFELLDEQLKSETLTTFVSDNFQQTRSIIWQEVLQCHSEDDVSDPANTPLLHSLATLHSILSMLFHLSSNQQEVRTVLLTSWASNDGLGCSILEKLSQLHASLVWELSLLLLEADNMAPNAEQSEKMDTTVDTIPLNIQQGTGEQIKMFKFVIGLLSDQLKTFHQLFVHIVRLAAATSPRRPRLGMMVPPINNASHCLAKAGCNAIRHVLSGKLPCEADVRAKLKYYQIAVGSLTWLYDDSNQPYHILLFHFNSCSDALKEIVEYLITLDPKSVELSKTRESIFTPPNSPAVAGKPLSSTTAAVSLEGALFEVLSEIRRLCSTSTIVESPNTIQQNNSLNLGTISNMARTNVDFDANTFVANMQIMAFQLVQKVWKSPLRDLPNSTISPLLIDILCYIIGSPQLNVSLFPSALICLLERKFIARNYYLNTSKLQELRFDLY